MSNVLSDAQNRELKLSQSSHRRTFGAPIRRLVPRSLGSIILVFMGKVA
jgi:hypothetical protein